MLYQDNGDGTMRMFGFYPYHVSGSDSISLPNGYVLNGYKSINTSWSLYNDTDNVYGMDGGNTIYLSGSSAGFSAITIDATINVRKTN